MIYIKDEESFIIRVVDLAGRSQQRTRNGAIVEAFRTALDELRTDEPDICPACGKLAREGEPH